MFTSQRTHRPDAAQLAGCSHTGLVRSARESAYFPEYSSHQRTPMYSAHVVSDVPPQGLPSFAAISGHRPGWPTCAMTDDPMYLYTVQRSRAWSGPLAGSGLSLKLNQWFAMNLFDTSTAYGRSSDSTALTPSRLPVSRRRRFAWRPIWPWRRDRAPAVGGAPALARTRPMHPRDRPSIKSNYSLVTDDW